MWINAIKRSIQVPLSLWQLSYLIRNCFFKICFVFQIFKTKTLHCDQVQIIQIWSPFHIQNNKSALLVANERKKTFSHVTTCAG